MSKTDVILSNRIPAKQGYPQIEKWLGQQLLKSLGGLPIRLILKDGEEISAPGVSPETTVLIRDHSTLAELMIDAEIAFAEAYAEGRIEVEGDLPRFLEAVYQSSAHAGASWYQRLTSKLMELWQANSIDGSRHNIHHHYDLGNDFYKLWLDSEMAYTCAYFPSPSATLEGAQVAKMDYICRKLQLQPGERVVEAGCGWGALALYMAEHYGASVKAFNISREQMVYARRQAVARGLSRQVEFIEDDYRNISGGFDVFVSVGMLEHVIVKRYAELGEVIHRSVGDSGRGLLHFIGRSYKGEFSRWIRKRIFPGAYAPTLAEVMNVLEPWHYSVLDVENLRLHYARTLEHWLERFEKASPQVLEMYGPWFQRAWRLYLAGSVAAFRIGTLQLFQVTFAGDQHLATAWTRAPLYAETRRARENAKWIHAMS
jgi:cyclopropane-fatty-acyl-phospholipid synthase